MMGDQIVCCTDCEHSFDAMDSRGWISARDAESSALCPLCYPLLRSSKDWAIWNDCNGVFETFPRRAEAQEAIKQRYAGCDATVVPVRVIAEPEGDVCYRVWQEDEREKLSA